VCNSTCESIKACRWRLKTGYAIYIYEAMDRAKEQIASNFKNEDSRYKKVWKITDTRWNLQLHRPLHAAAYYLNPK